MTRFRIQSVSPSCETIEFDVCPYEFELLNAGTTELMQAFLDALELEDVAPVSWTIRRCCSAYYASCTVSDTAPLRDRYKQFFRVELTCSRDVGRVTDDPFKFGGCEETDVTWHPPTAGALFRWDELECVVIADFFEAVSTKTLARLAAGFPRTTCALPGGIQQLRIELGPLRTDGDDTAIQDVMRSLAAEGASVNAETSEYRAVSAEV
jgi:hypothetical protein